MGSLSFTRPTKLTTYYKAWSESKNKKDRKYWSKAIKKELKNNK